MTIETIFQDLTNYDIESIMPKSIEPIDDFLLYNDESNRKILSNLMKNQYKKEIIYNRVDSQYYTLYRLDSSYYLVDKEINKIVYYVHYKYDNRNRYKKIGKEFIWQALVWNNGSVRGFATELFLEVLLQKYKTILTDSQQTWNGKSFWNNLVTTILRNKAPIPNINIYYFDLMKKEDPIRINTVKEYDDILRQYDVYGTFQAHEPKRLVITLKEF